MFQLGQKKAIYPKKTGSEINSRAPRSRVIGLIVDTVRKLRAVARLTKHSKAQRQEAVEYMKILREHGFTNRDINIIVEGRWKEPTIKRYTRGVKTVSMDERDKLLRTLSDFSSTGGTIENLEHFLSYEQQILNLRIDHVTVLNLIDDIIREGLPIIDLIALKDFLIKSGITVDDIIKYMVDIEALNKEGIFDQELDIIINMARSFGGVAGLNKAFEKYGNLEAITNAEIMAKGSLVFVESEHSKLLIKYNSLKSFVDFAEILMTVYSFNLETVGTLVTLSGKFGGITSVIEALMEYGSIRELRLEKTKEINLGRKFKSQTDAYSLELLDLSEKVKEMHQDIGEIKANYKQSLRLQKIQDLLTRPREAEMDSTEFLRLVSALLSGILEYGESNKESVKDWNRFNQRLEYARVEINSILLGS